jgi:glycine/D-amino acid oxidase-like deaminating enzyme
VPYFDVAVVGAGIAGCLIAQEITDRSPGTSIAVLDRGAVGGGASRFSAGLHFPRGATERVRRMTSYSQAYYDGLRARRAELPIWPARMYVMAATGHADRLAEVYLPDAGLTRQDRSHLRLGDGLVRVPPDVGLWQGSGCQYADVPALAQALAAGLRPGVVFHEGLTVTSVRPGPSGVTLGLGSGRSLEAGRVVLAPGPWLAADAWSALLAPLRARVKKVVALHLDIRAGVDDPVIVFHDEDAFLLPMRHRGHWLFSYTCTEWDVDPDQLTNGLRADDLDTAHAVLDRYAPGLSKRCTSGRVFCDAYSATGEPEIRTLDPDGRIVFAGAANGSGYRLGPAVAAATGDLLSLPARSAARSDSDH